MVMAIDETTKTTQKKVTATVQKEKDGLLFYIKKCCSSAEAPKKC